MMSERASSFPPVNTSWMRVAQRTLELFTQVKSTAEEGQECGWVSRHPRPSPSWWATAKSSPGCRTGCLMQQPECQKPPPPAPAEASFTGGWQLEGCPLPKSSRRGLPRWSSG